MLLFSIVLVLCYNFYLSLFSCLLWFWLNILYDFIFSLFLVYPLHFFYFLSVIALEFTTYIYDYPNSLTRNTTLLRKYPYLLVTKWPKFFISILYFIVAIHFLYINIHKHYTGDIYICINNQTHCYYYYFEKLSVRSVMNRKNRSFYFIIIYSFFNALPFFM